MAAAAGAGLSSPLLHNAPGVLHFPVCLAAGLQEEGEEEQGALGWHPSHPHRQQQYALPGREAPMLLQSRVS